MFRPSVGSETAGVPVRSADFKKQPADLLARHLQ
eukprot:COSAG01_NODE_68066_length_265_cov_0.626506_1_plen_33_part_01